MKKLVVLAICAVLSDLVLAQTCDVAAFVWPAYQNEPRWAELGIFGDGHGEWQNQYEAVQRGEGDYHTRKPLWGYEDESDPKVMERKIDAAVSSGVNVFIYDWYWYGGRPFLENALNEGFLKAPNVRKMKFYLMWANHDVRPLWDNRIGGEAKRQVIWPAKVSEADYRLIVDRWIERYFKLPNYYTIDGKPVFMIYDLRGFANWDGIEVAKRRIDYLRERVKAAGLPGLHLQCNSLPLKEMEALGVESSTIYNWTFGGIGVRLNDETLPEPTYAEWGALALEKMAENMRTQRQAGRCFIPNLTLGWDTNARFPPNERKRVVRDANPVDFERLARQVKEMALASADATAPRLITVNSWNEWTEGSYLEPDDRYGTAYLDAMRRVFAPDAQKLDWPARQDEVTFDDGRMANEIAGAARSGAKKVDLPGGRIFVSTADKTYFRLSKVNDLIIDFHGADLIGRKTTRFFELTDSTNVTIRNVSLDYANLPYTQAVIEKVDAEKNWDVRILGGYPVPTLDVAGDREAWPVQVYDRQQSELVNKMRYQDDVKVTKTGPDTFRITGGKDRTGNVGDYVVWSLRQVCELHTAVRVERSSGCRFENVTVYSTPMGAAFWEADSSSNAYVNCRLKRRGAADDFAVRAHKRLRSGNHDAFNARRDYVGPLVDGCDFEYQCDDGVNISGFYAVVSAVKGRTIRILPYCGNLLIAPGDPCQVMTAAGDVSDVTALSVTPAGDVTDAERAQIAKWRFTHGIGASLKRTWEVALDREATFAPGSCIISSNRRGDGFRIVRSHFGSNRARGLLIKASNGLIESNVIERVGCGLAVYPEFTWLEGGSSQNLLIRGNVLRHGAQISIGGKSGEGKPLPPEAHANCTLIDNVVR